MCHFGCRLLKIKSPYPYLQVYKYFLHVGYCLSILENMYPPRTPSPQSPPDLTTPPVPPPILGGTGGHNPPTHTPPPPFTDVRIPAQSTPTVPSRPQASGAAASLSVTDMPTLHELENHKKKIIGRVQLGLDVCKGYWHLRALILQRS